PSRNRSLLLEAVAHRTRRYRGRPLPRSARPGQDCFLKNGRWDDKQIVSQEWVKASVTPAIAVAPGAAIKYGLKWWLFPYGDGTSRLAWAGSGFGGQMPIILPDYDLVMVFTGWNILPDRLRFSQRLAIDRVLHAITDRPQ